MKKIFVYGSLILGKSPIKLIPIESVFIIEHKLRLRIKENSTYLLLQMNYTGKSTDIVSGYLAEISEEELIRLDKYEGKNYERKELTIFKRDHTPIKAFAYVGRN